MKSIEKPRARMIPSGHPSFSALILVTALVVRLVKIRAEINGWNKPGQNNDPAGDAIMTSD
jgi:hypothetical protein